MTRAGTSLRCLAVALGALAAPLLSAAPLRFTTINDAQGLSENSVTSVVEDHQGFLWIGTQNGLNRFDGLEFKIYAAGNDPTQELVEDYINVLHVDRAGRLWIGTFAGGLSRYDPQRGVFDNYLHDPADPGSLGHNDVSAIHETADGAIWVGTRGGGVYRIDPHGGDLVQVPLTAPDEAAADDISAICAASGGGVWIGVLGAGLVELGPDRQPRRRLRADAGTTPRLPSDDINALLLDAQGALWIGTRRNGLARLRADGDYRTYRNDPRQASSLAHDAVNALYQDPRGAIWVATVLGLDQYDASADGFRHNRHAPGNPLTLPYDDISSVYEDSIGTLWVGTGGRGLARHEEGSGQFELLVHDPSDPRSLSPSGVWSVREGRDGSLMVGTFGGGLHRRARGDDGFERLEHDARQPDSLSDNDVRALLEDRDGRWWVGTRRGLNRLEPGASRFRHYFRDRDAPAGLSHDFVRVLLEDSAGRIWVGTYGGGLDRYERETDSFVHHRHRSGEDDTLSDDRIYSLLEGDAGTLWVGTHGGGLNRLEIASGGVRRYRHDARDPDSLSSDRVLALLAGRHGELWIGTAAGLDRFEPASGRFERQEALGSDAVLGLVADDTGVLWMSKTDGIVRFDPARGEIRHFDLDDQLVSNEFNGGSAFRGGSGRIYFGGVEGLVAVTPGIEPVRPPAAVPMLTEFLAFNRPVRTQAFDPSSPLAEPIEFASRLVLPHPVRTFGFAFAALRTPDPALSTFAYRLEGFDEQWIETGTRNRTATFTNVPPGDYVFRVRTTDAEGHWMPVDASVRVAILPWPWRSTWAYAGYALLAGAALAVVWAARRRRALEKLAAQRAIMDELDARVHQRTAELHARQAELEATIDELRRTQGELIEAEKMASLGRLVAGVAHEVNTPLGIGVTALTFLRGQLAAIREALSRHLRPEQTQALFAPVDDAGAMVETNLVRAANLIRSFKQVAVDQSSSSIRTVAVREYLDGTLQSLNPTLKKTAHRVIVECEPTLEMSNRPDALYQVIANLVLNSLMHGYPDGRPGILRITVAAEGASLKLRYTDDGVGMESAVAARVFEPFFTTKRGAGGTGLGLHVVYNLVSQALAGRIQCSTAPGEGVRFDIVFPRVHPQATTRSAG